MFHGIISGFEFQAACWIVLSKYSIACIISLYIITSASFKDTCVYFSLVRGKAVLLLCSTPDCILLNTLLLTLIIIGE